MAASTTEDHCVEVSRTAVDPDWDRFLARAPGGHHAQTSLWGQLKSRFGAPARRIIVRRGGRDIVAGAQLLVRRLPVGGALGYVPKGPVIAPEAADDPALVRVVVEGLRGAATAERVRYLVVQPPDDGHGLAEHLTSLGFQPTSLEIQPTATVRIDLTESLDEIMARMRKKTRRYIRHGLRHGLAVRQGDEADLPCFYRLLSATAERNGFTPFPVDYFNELWRQFGPHGHARLLICELDGEAVSAQLLIPFGDTVVAKHSGWSGRHGALGPNHVLEWETIRWAREQGYRYYDLEGLDRDFAEAVLNNALQPDPAEHGQFYYKLSLGGEVTLFPRAYDYVYNPVLRASYNLLVRRLLDQPVITRALYRLRTR